MHSIKTRIQLALAAVLWIAAIAGMAWVVARHGRKDFRDFTPEEVLADFTPTRLREAVALDGAGSVLVTVAAPDGSYTLWLPGHYAETGRKGSKGIWLANLGLQWLPVDIQSKAGLETAVRDNIARGLESGRLDQASEAVARSLLTVL